MIRLLSLAIGLPLLLAGCEAASAASASLPRAVSGPKSYVALSADFASYRDWTPFDRGRDRVPPTHDADSVIYVDRTLAPGAREYPIGTRIVRVERHGEEATTWELHAMVKRGGDYNDGGARGWEFFELSHIDDGPPLIVWRGHGPPDGDGYRPPDGSDDVLSCNHCHGAFPDNDSVLSPVLALGGAGAAQ